MENGNLFVTAASLERMLAVLVTAIVATGSVDARVMANQLAVLSEGSEGQERSILSKVHDCLEAVAKAREERAPE